MHGCRVPRPRLLSRPPRDSLAAKEKHHDVDRDRRRHAAPCAAVLHHAGHRGQGAGRPCARGRGRRRPTAARARARPVDHLLQRSRRAVLPHHRAAVHRPCRRRGDRRIRRPEISLEDSERDRLRTGAPALPAEFRSGLHLDGEDRLRHRHPAHPFGPHRPGAADLRQRLSAAAADHGALLPVRPGGGPHRHGARA